MKQMVIVLEIVLTLMVCACTGSNVDTAVLETSLTEEVKNIFSYEVVRDILVQAKRQVNTENQNYRTLSYGVRYKLEIPSEFVHEKKWSDDMYVYLDFAGFEWDLECMDEPSYVLYIDGNKEVAYLYDEGYGYAYDEGYHKEVHDSYKEQYGNGGSVIDTYVFVFEEGELLPYTYDFPEKEGLYDQMVQAISGALKNRGAEYAKICIKNTSISEWTEEMSFCCAADVYCIQDNKLYMCFFYIQCEYNQEPEILREHAIIIADGTGQSHTEDIEGDERQFFDVGLLLTEEKESTSGEYYRVETVVFEREEIRN